MPDSPAMRSIVVVLLAAACSSTAPPPPPSPSPAPPPPARQNPSPMADTTRAHERVVRRTPGPEVTTIAEVLSSPVTVRVTDAARAAGRADLVIHFHGAAWLPVQEGEATGRPLVIAAVGLGAGSRRYAMPFEDANVFTTLVQKIREISPPIDRIHLTAFSAGYGAIREILSDHASMIDGVLLLDGLHASYVPDEKPLADGGALNAANLEVFVDWARRAAAGEKRFVITHSEIFPGTFASTTETADYVLHALGMKRTPVLRWGPLGMQQLSEAKRGRFDVFGFAGNSAPDHIDHLHAYATFLAHLFDR